MSYLSRQLSVLMLLIAGVAVAQPSPQVRQLRQRVITLPSGPEDSSLRVAKGTLTTLTFDSPLLPKGVVMQGRDSHFERFVAEERTLTFKPKVDLAEGERLLLTVRFADGSTPQEATFQLVPAAEEVDAQVEVLRRARTAEALNMELVQMRARLATLEARCGEDGPEGLVFSGWLSEDIHSQPFVAQVPTGNSSGLKVAVGVSYRTKKWALIVLLLRNLPGQAAWTPGQVRLTTAKGAPVTVLSVRMDKPRLAADEEGLLVVRTAAPWWSSEEEFRLELKDKDGGRLMPLSGVAF